MDFEVTLKERDGQNMPDYTVRCYPDGSRELFINRFSLELSAQQAQVLANLLLFNTGKLTQ